MEEIRYGVVVFAGGGLGSLARYAVSRGLAPYAQAMPLGTLVANVLSCFIVGMMVALAGHRLLGQPLYRHLVMTGFCGGFSTFSTWVRENWEMGKNGQVFHLTLYNALSMGLGMAALLLGIWMGKRIVT